MKLAINLGILFITVFSSTSCQIFKVSAINRKAFYTHSDTLVVKVSNKSEDSVRFYFGLECFFENKWSEIDNDIFRNEEKENFFFGIKAKESKFQKVPISQLAIDTIFANMKYRIVVKVLPINNLIYETFYLSAFEIRE